MRVIVLMLLLAIVLFGLTNTISALALNNCYLKLLSTATIEYSFENISAKTIILDISLLRYKLADESYIIVTLGYPPLNLYGFAILNRNNTISYYSIRGDQNHWHKVTGNISDNIIVRVEVHNRTLTYELMSRGMIIDIYKTNTSLYSLELRNLVLTIASPYDTKDSWLIFKELVLTANNNVIVDLLPDNNTLAKIKEEDHIYPMNNIQVVCIKPITITKTLTYNYTSTITANPITTTRIVETTKTYTATIYTTLTTSIVKTFSSIITENTTITTTKTIISTYTTTSTKEVFTTPMELYLTIIAITVITIILAALLLQRK